MNTLAVFLIAVVAVATAAPSAILVDEDPEPVATVTTCGGLVNTSSAAINFQLGESIPAGQVCLWTVQAPYDAIRFTLKESGLGMGDSLKLTRFIGAVPGYQYNVTEVGANYTYSAGTVLVTLVTGASASSGFSLEMYSSGDLDAGGGGFTHYETFQAATGATAYPGNGQPYMDDEVAVFIVSPSESGSRTLTFTGMDVEDSTGCIYDSVEVFSWSVSMDHLHSEARVCGSALPPPIMLETGLGVIIFKTDSSVTQGGFAFNWM
ncbi:bone morphogenetic protein 1 homolog [Folsomia candida]|nr:bone morphogenetic protein 1 homolog [Folsomia candida]